MKKRFEFLIVLFGLFIIGLNFVSAAAPTFITVPDNSSLFYGNQSLDVIFNATNTSEFGSYYINNTNFTIIPIGFITENQTARLINATPMAAGNYAINVTITNGAGGANTSVTYTVQVNQSNYFDCGVYFNATSPIIYPATFIVYTNCSSPYNLYRNGTSISNASIVNSGAGYYNLTVQRTDTVNYTNTVGTEFFTVNKNDEEFKVLFNATTGITYPDKFLAWANSTTAFVLARNETTISNNSVQNNGAGYFNFTAQRNDTANYSYTYNESEFRVIKNPEKCQVFFNLTSPQTYPKVFLAWGNCTSAFVLSRNGTTIANNSAQDSLAVDAYNFSVFRNDTTNYTYTYNYSQFIISPDTTSPTYAQNSSINVYGGLTSSFSIYIDDDSSLVSNGTYSSGMYIFSTNNTGAWVNDSAVNFTTTPSWANVTKTLNSSAGTLVGYMWYFNDTSFNTNSTLVYKLTTILEEPVDNEAHGTSSSSGGGSSSNTYTTDQQFSESGDEYTLKVSDKVNFVVGSTSHSLTLNQFNSTTAKVSIASNPIIAYLQKGVLYDFDMNGDSVKDINVRYNGLISGKASIFMQGIKQIVASDQGAEADTSLEDEEAPVNEDVASDQGAEADTSLGESKKLSTTKIILIIIGAVIIILLVVLFFFTRKKHYK